MNTVTAPIDRAARAALVGAAGRLRHGTIVLDEGGSTARFGEGDPVVTVTVNDPRFYGAWRRGSCGLADSYRLGWWDCDDLTAFVQVLYRNLAGPGRLLDRLATVTGPVVDPLARLRRTDKAVDRQNIHAHYDLGNDFYGLMLDESMTYSAALFEFPDQSLAGAQVAKLDRLCRHLELTPDDHVIEVGGGWGSFAVYAATWYGCRVTTTTISAAQFEYLEKRVAAAGLGDRVTVLDRDYRDLDARGGFDKLVSIEMIEAVDWRDHGRYFEAVAGLLRPGGRAALQAIVINDGSFERAKRHDDFIRAYIFPGGCLPSVGSILTGARRAGLLLAGLEDIGGHYPETLRRWRAACHRNEAAIGDLGFDEPFRRLWDLYLTYCEAAFLEHHVSDVQVVLTKPV